MVFVEEVGELVDLDMWAGYEFWSLQLEARMEEIAETLGAVAPSERATRQLPAIQEGASDVLPF